MPLRLSTDVEVRFHGPLLLLNARCPVCGLMVGMERAAGDVYKVLFHLTRGVTCNGINRMGRLLRLEQALRSVQ